VKDFEAALAAAKAAGLHRPHTFTDRRNLPQSLCRDAPQAGQTLPGVRTRNPAEKLTVEQFQSPAVEGKQRLIARQQRQHRLGQPMGEMSNSDKRRPQRARIDRYSHPQQAPGR
jgi:hypothetical protein